MILYLHFSYIYKHSADSHNIEIKILNLVI